MIGERVGNWIIEAESGKNEMGRLYRAHAADEPERIAAIKRLTHPKSKTAEFEKLFLAQIDLLRKLKHPHIVAMLDGGMHEGAPYFAMEWIDGPNFETILRRGERPNWPEVLAIALQILPALRHAHRRSVLHRDMKPSNLFRVAEGTYKLADFGITKFFGDALLTNADNVLGSASYLSPEQAAGRPHTKRSDFYALGSLLYTLIVGRPPFTGNTVVEMIQKHCFVLPERPIHFVRDLPEEIDRFVMKLLAKEPAQRPGSGTLLIQEVEGIWSAFERRGLLAKKPVAAVVAEDDNDIPPDEEAAAEPRFPEPIPQAPIPWHKRWYVIVMGFSACVLLLLWAFLWRGPSADDLMAQARPLLESDNPADWDKAWNEYLEPLARKYPNKYENEVKDARRRIDEQGELRRAFVAGKKNKYRSEAERLYHVGLRLVQAGEFASARRVWDILIREYDATDGEKRWVRLAREAVNRVDQIELGNARPALDLEIADTVRPVVAEIQRLRAADKTKEAEDLSRSLQFLYRDHPRFDALREMLEPH